jgi:hypothetical protein
MRRDRPCHFEKAPSCSSRVINRADLYSTRAGKEENGVYRNIASAMSRPRSPSVQGSVEAARWLRKEREQRRHRERRIGGGVDVVDDPAGELIPAVALTPEQPATDRSNRSASKA